MIQSYTGFEFGMLYFFYENQSKNFALEETITMSKLVNLKAAPPIESFFFTFLLKNF